MEIKDQPVYIYKLEVDHYPSYEEISLSAYSFLKKLSLPVRKRVILKPNITVPADMDSGIITHPAFISGMLSYFLEIGLSGDDIMVAEGAGEPGPHGMDEHFKRSGYRDLSKQQGIKLVNLNLDEIVPFRLKDAEFLKSISIAKSIVDSDNYFINVPKYKTHNLAVTTLCMKNLMGTIVPVHTRHLCAVWREYAERQNEITNYGITLREEHLCRKICDLSLASRPDFNIIEGIIGRDGTAFHHGKNIQTNLIIGGRNPVNVDAVGSYLMGFDPSGIGYLRIAEERGLGTINVKKMEILEVREDGIVPCDDIDSFMSPVPFEVLTWEKRVRNIRLNDCMKRRLQTIGVSAEHLEHE